MKAREIVIEHVVEEDGILRPLRPEDMLLDENVHVEDAFRVLMDMLQQQKNSVKG